MSSLEHAIAQKAREYAAPAGGAKEEDPVGAKKDREFRVKQLAMAVCTEFATAVREFLNTLQAAAEVRVVDLHAAT